MIIKKNTLSSFSVEQKHAKEESPKNTDKLYFQYQKLNTESYLYIANSRLLPLSIYS